MSTPPAHPVHASVAFFRIAQFEALPVARQASLKEQLEERMRSTLGPISELDRIVLDAEDGVALVLFEEPARALDRAQAIHAGARMTLQAGLNYGPLALSSASSEARVFGDGLAEAVTAARFAAPDRMLVTDDFSKALAASAPDRAIELVGAGDFTDTRVRMHTFFTPDPERRAARRRRLTVFAIGGAVIILLLGVVGRDIYQPLFASRPATVVLDVRPRGEVFVDGVSQGRVPPLKEIQVAPGKRRVQIRLPGARAYDVTHDLKAGQRVTVSHTFPRVEPAKPDLWRDLKKKFS